MTKCFLVVTKPTKCLRHVYTTYLPEAEYVVTEVDQQTVLVDSG